jgi:hypothetical protein
MQILIDRDGTFIAPAKTRTRVCDIEGTKSVTITEGLRPGRQVIEADIPPRDRMWWRGGAWEDKPPMSPFAPDDVKAAEQEDELRTLVKSMTRPA